MSNETIFNTEEVEDLIAHQHEIVDNLKTQKDEAIKVYTTQNHILVELKDYLLKQQELQKLIEKKA